MKAVVVPAKSDWSCNTSPFSYHRSVLGPYKHIESIERRAREWATFRGYTHWVIEVWSGDTITSTPDLILQKSVDQLG